LQQAEIPVLSALDQSAFPNESKARAPECDVSVDGVSENVENAANKAKSVSDQDQAEVA
jgi:hypothetical protein